MSARSRGRVVQSSEHGRWERWQPVSQLRLLGLSPVQCPSVPHLTTAHARKHTHLHSRSAIVVESWLRRAWVVVCACDVCVVICLLFSKLPPRSGTQLCAILLLRLCPDHGETTVNPTWLDVCGACAFRFSTADPPSARDEHGV